MRFDNNKNPLNIPLFGKIFSFNELDIDKCSICGYQPGSNYLLAWLIETVSGSQNNSRTTCVNNRDIIDYSFNKEKRYKLLVIEFKYIIEKYSQDKGVINWLKSKDL